MIATIDRNIDRDADRSTDRNADWSMDKPLHFSLDTLKTEAYELVCCGQLDRQQPIYSLCQFIPAREWPQVECELERNDYLLRDRLIDLITQLECWPSD
jgi:hypothetical protein